MAKNNKLDIYDLAEKILDTKISPTQRMVLDCLNHWCDRCKKMVFAETREIVTKEKTHKEFRCRECHTTIMIDEMCNYKEVKTNGPK